MASALPKDRDRRAIFPALQNIATQRRTSWMSRYAMRIICSGMSWTAKPGHFLLCLNVAPFVHLARDNDGEYKRAFSKFLEIFQVVEMLGLERIRSSSRQRRIQSMME